MLLTLASGDLSAQIRLTDVTIFSADNVGNWTGPDIWQTRPRGHYVIFIQDGPSGGPFLNGQTSEAVQPNIPLPLGDYSFRIAASAGADYPNFGINLFFDGATKPSISAFAPLRTSPTAPHSFEASKASYTSGPVPYNGVPGAGTLSFESGNQRITLVDFYWATPSAYDLDLVGGYSPGPDGMNDYVGVMMLSVTPLEPTPPRIVTQPSDQIASAGFDATFSVTAVGSLPFSYQWFFEGSALTDATNAQLSLTNLTLAQAGAYSVQITNLYGSVTSAVAKLSVVSVSTAFFDDFELYAYRSQWATFGGVILATNYGGSVSGTNSLWFGGYGSRFAVTRPLDTSNGGVVQFYLRLGDQDFYTNRFSSNWELVELTHKGIVLESSTDGGQTWVELGRYDTPDFYQWTKVTLPISKEAQSAGTQFRWRQLYNTGAPFDHWALDDVLIALGPTPPVVVTQPQSSTNGTETSVTFRAVVTGSRPMTYQWRHDESDLTNDTRIVGADSDTLTISGLQLSDAGNYALIATNPNGSTTSVVAVLTVLLSPSITTQPISQTILEGENVTFDVIAEGTPPLFYHWQKNGRILFGATGKSLSLTNAHLFDAGDYTVVVANSVASTTSAVAVLTVQAPPVIT
ncbi:MAG TPA: immunoglobulin domain-containing protein, partial [Clostridia bacterium]|nr:immunoglobulin domain-containing protein [Clostridia bacterium]